MDFPAHESLGGQGRTYDSQLGLLQEKVAKLGKVKTRPFGKPAHLKPCLSGGTQSQTVPDKIYGKIFLALLDKGSPFNTPSSNPPVFLFSGREIRRAVCNFKSPSKYTYSPPTYRKLDILA